MLVFAFGSNLSCEQMRKRCPGCTLVGPAMLDGYRLAFGAYSRGWNGGVATVVLAKRHKVRGVLYRMEEFEVCRLDSFEGVPYQYQRVSGCVRWNRRRVMAQWYALNDKPFQLPSARYLATIAAGYHKNRFSRKALREALRFTKRCMLRELASRPVPRRCVYDWTPHTSGRVAPPTARQIEMWAKRQ